MKNLRYSRIASINEIGNEGIEKLKNGKVLVIGCGALGSLCSMYLAASGVGTIGIADFDTIDISNLQRQLFFNEESLGKSKLKILSKRMSEINSEIAINEYQILINYQTALEIFPSYNFIIDGSDNPSTKKMTSQVCEKLEIPYCIGGVKEFSGQVMSWLPGCAGYIDLFGDFSTECGMSPCAINGVIGPAAGVVASVQAAEAIKYLCNVGSLIVNRLYSFNLLPPSSSIYTF